MLRQSIATSILLIILFIASCSPAPKKTNLPLPTMIASYSQNGINITIFKTPQKLTLAQDIFLRIEIDTPLGTTATIPNLSPYCSGFNLVSEFNTPTTITGNRTTYSRHIHLQPEISTIYALEPFAISYKDRSYNPAVTGSIETSKIIFQPALQPLPPSTDIIADFSPIEPRTAQKAKIAKVIAILLFALIIVTQTIRYHFNSKDSGRNEPIPRSMALQNLEKLLKSDLLIKNEFNEFYFTLTGIVRCYIEEMLKIPSTHQTSEELTNNLENDQRITAETLADLRKFFQRADLIKFATIAPSPAELANDIEWAKQYIESDLVEKEKEELSSC